MTVLSDGTIRRLVNTYGDPQCITIDPYDEQNVQPASVDLCLDNQFRVFSTHSLTHIDPFSDENITQLVVLKKDERFVLHSGQFVLASTLEVITLPDTLIARVEGKSSLGRLGLQIHSTAGFVDPGFSGHITLELSNVATLPIELTPGMKVCQLSLMYLDLPAEVPYGSQSIGSRYQGQRGPTASQYFKNPRPVA